MENAAENFRQIARTVGTEAKLSEKSISLSQMEIQRKNVFDTLSDEEINDIVDKLFKLYCKAESTANDALSRCNDVEVALGMEVKGHSAENQRHFYLRQLADSELENHVSSVRASSVDLAGSLEPNIVETLSVLQSAKKFVDSLKGMGQVDCPACGQSISIDAFLEHVNNESDRLRELNDTFVEYKAAIGSICSSIDSLKSNLGRSELKTWKEGDHEAVVFDGFKYLEEFNVNEFS